MSEQNLPGSTRANQEAQAPQQPSPVISVRLSIHTPPILTRQTSILSAKGSFELRSPFMFVGFGPSTLPESNFRRASDIIRDTIQAAYEAGCSDGSCFVSIGGSRFGSIRDWNSPSPTTSQLVCNQQGINEASYQWDETDVNNPAATSSAAFAELAGQNATTLEQTVKDKIQTFHIADDEPSGPSQTAPPAQNLDKKIAKKTYDAQKSSVTKMINKF
jgi:hypothetical protein